MKATWHAIAAIAWGLNVWGAIGILWDQHPIHAILLAGLCASRALAHTSYFFGYEVYPIVKRLSLGTSPVPTVRDE